jgi:Mn-dependent DtxR family transcriptional regulator
VDVRDRFRDQLAALAREGYLEAADEDRVALTRAGLLRVDRLLRRFFLPQHVSVRYT